MLRAIERGLTVRDFEVMTFGMVAGYITAYSNELQDDNTRQAAQADFDRF